MNVLQTKVDNRLKELGINAFEAARRAGLPRQSIWDLVKGHKQSFGSSSLAQIANALEWTVADLVDDFIPGEHMPASYGTLRVLPLKGVAQAGAWRERDDNPLPDGSFSTMLPDANYDVSHQFAMQIHGDSMNDCKPVSIPDRSSVRCVEWSKAGLAMRAGLLVIVERTSRDGALVEKSLKKVADAIGGGLELRSETTGKNHAPISLVVSGKQFGDGIKIIGVVTAVQTELLMWK